MTIRSRAAVAGSKGSFTIDNIQVSPPKGDEVLVKIKAAALCHTDLDILNGNDFPHVMGHEGAGIIADIGPNVTDFKTGDPVVLNWAMHCGACLACADKRIHLCENYSVANGDGVSGHAHSEGTTYKGKPIRRSFYLGALSEYTIVRQSAVCKLHDKIPYSSASILSCGVMTGFGSAVNAAKVKPGSSVAVLGCGGVGINVVQGCRIAGATRIIAIDITQKRLDQAKEFGATHGILSDPKDTTLASARDSIFALTHRGADYAFECTSIPTMADAPLRFIRHGGMAVQVSGIEQPVNFDCSLFEWDKIYINPLYGQCNPKRDFAIMQDLYHTGELKLDEQITKTYRLDELQHGFADMLSGKLAKGVVLFD
ncbi:MAG: alcohol dehydrogenase catalytic domain-containing protein [Cellvibrionales bacterium]|nr:alcohol dehydrogenase catalytic domain-containing protein [Cellvibrionales bacterium]